MTDLQYHEFVMAYLRSSALDLDDPLVQSLCTEMVRDYADGNQERIQMRLELLRRPELRCAVLLCVSVAIPNPLPDRVNDYCELADARARLDVLQSMAKARQQSGSDPADDAGPSSAPHGREKGRQLGQTRTILTAGFGILGFIIGGVFQPLLGAIGQSLLGPHLVRLTGSEKLAAALQVPPRNVNAVSPSDELNGKNDDPQNGDDADGPPTGDGNS